MSLGLSSNEGVNDFVKNGFRERCGQKPDCNGLPGEVTFESGREWQVRNCGVPALDHSSVVKRSQGTVAKGREREGAPPRWRRPGEFTGCAMRRENADEMLMGKGIMDETL